MIDFIRLVTLVVIEFIRSLAHERALERTRKRYAEIRKNPGGEWARFFGRVPTADRRTDADPPADPDGGVSYTPSDADAYKRWGSGIAAVGPGRLTDLPARTGRPEVQPTDRK